jgi:uncharacterized protein
MRKISISGNLYIKTSKIPNAGRGVFASKNIQKGGLIETCPIIVIPTDDAPVVTVLANYLFFFGKNKKHAAIVLGYGSIYNHSYSPNSTFKIKPKDAVVIFVATKAVKKDEEITFDYKHGSITKKPLWFEAN